MLSQLVIRAPRFAAVHGHLATASGRHYAPLSLCLRRHSWLTVIVALKQLNDGPKA